MSVFYEWHTLVGTLKVSHIEPILFVSLIVCPRQDMQYLRYIHFAYISNIFKEIFCYFISNTSSENSIFLQYSDFVKNIINENPIFLQCSNFVGNIFKDNPIVLQYSNFAGHITYIKKILVTQWRFIECYLEECNMKFWCN